MMALRIVLRGLGAVSTIVLARLLTPDDYGVVAIAMSLYAILEMFAQFGVDFSLVRKPKLEPHDYHTAFTFQLTLYTSLALVLFFLSDAVGSFYDDSRLTLIVQTLSGCMFLSGLNNIALVDFRRELRFDMEFKLDVLIKSINFVSTITLAVILRNYWALVIGIVVGRSLRLLFGYWFRPYWPNFSLRSIAEIFHFSKWVFLMNLGGYLLLQLPNLVLGKMVSTHAVGLYSISSELSQAASQEISAGMNRPVYSGFAMLAEDLVKLRDNFLQVLGLQATIIMPLGFGLSSVAVLAVPVLLGERWLEATTPVALLSASLGVGSVSTCCIYVFMAMNRTHLCFINVVVSLICFVPLVFLWVSELGPQGVAQAHLVASIATSIFVYGLVSHQLAVNLFRVLAVITRPFLAASTMLLVNTQVVLPWLAAMPLPLVTQLFVAVAIGALVYGVVLVVGWLVLGRPKGAERQILELALARLKTRRQSG